MNEELNVELGLDIKKYSKSLNDALAKFNTFKTGLDDVKLGFDETQIEQLHQIFSDIRSTAIKELDKIQSRMDKLTIKGLDLGSQKTETQDRIEKVKSELNITWNKSDKAKLEAELEGLLAKLSGIEAKIQLNDEDLNEAHDQYDFLLSELQENPLDVEYESAPLIKFNSDLDNVIDGLDRTGKEVDETSDKMDDFSRSTERASKSGFRLNLMGRVMSQIRNTIAAAINPLNIFRRSWNEIINSDTSKFGNTFKNIKANILEYLTPAFEWIAQRIINLIGYVNVFLKAMSGGKIDLFKKSAASAKKMSGYAKEASKSVASFDEINDIGDSGGSGGSGTSDPGLVQPDLNPEWVKTLEDWGKKAGEVWEKVKEFFKGLKDNIGTIGLIALGIGAVVVVFTLLSKVSGGLGGDLLGVALALAAVAAVILTLTNLLQVMNETGMSIGDVALVMIAVMGPLIVAIIAFAAAAKMIDIVGLAAIVVIFIALATSMRVVADILLDLKTAGIGATDALAMMAVIVGSIIALVIAFTAAAVILGSNPLALIAIVALMAAIVATLLTMALVIPIILDAVGKFIVTIGPTLNMILNTIFEHIEKIVYIIGTVLPPIIRSIGSVFNTIFKGICSIIQTAGNVIVSIMNTAKSLITTVLKSILDFINQLGPAIEGFVDSIIRSVTKLVNFIISAIEYMVNLATSGINKIIDGINKVSEIVGVGIPHVPKFTIPRFVPSYDVGANYIPNDQLAVVHKGEAIIPAKFNDEKFFNQQDNSETNELLTQVIEAINNIEINPYTTVKDVGTASVNYIKEKSRVLGRSVI